MVLDESCCPNSTEPTLQNVCSPKRSRRIYLAGSWKNAESILALRDLLKAEGHEVDCFASTDTGRTSFNWSELIGALGCQERAEAEVKLAGMDAIDLLSFERVIEAFREDRKYLDWCDTCILILPSGKSAHLEAGYAKGSGKDLFIFGEFLKGERDVMYGFADGLFREDELYFMLDVIRHDAVCEFSCEDDESPGCKPNCILEGRRCMHQQITDHRPIYYSVRCGKS